MEALMRDYLEDDGAMIPRAFLNTVLHELSLDERVSLLADEKQRRTTIFVNWPHDGNLSGIKMAQAGFYCVDNNDRVQCVFCRGSLHNWEEGDNPMTEHAKMFPFCRFAKGLECGNKEYRIDVLEPEELRNITFLCVPGFYYTGFDDEVRCFFCAGGLQGWSAGVDPWQEHAKYYIQYYIRWFPDCPFLIQCKGEAYVNEVHRTTSCARQTTWQKKAEQKHKQKVSDQKAMYDLCVKMGHERRLVDLAINQNGKAFDNAKDLIAAVYKLEEEDMIMECAHQTVLQKKAEQKHKQKVSDQKDVEMEPFEHQTIFDARGYTTSIYLLVSTCTLWHDGCKGFETEAEGNENKSNQQTAYVLLFYSLTNILGMLIKQCKAVLEYTTRGSTASHPKHGRVFSNNEDSKKGLPQQNFSEDRNRFKERRFNHSGQTRNDQENNYYTEKGLDWVFYPLRHGIQSAVSTPQREILCYPVARYPDNQNPLLPLSLQKKLGAMSPREFLETVLRELSLDERESLLVDEKQRRTTFLVNWPHDGNLSGIKMAQAGFYCVDNYDRVQCVFCRGSLHKWEEGDNPMTEHAKMFPFCRFAKGLECGNKEYRSDVLGTEELRNITFLCVPELKKNRDGSVTTNSNALGISTNKAAIIKYAIIESRKNTFARWPASNALDADSLWEAGFYYTGFDDQVRCFFCAGGLRDWSAGDDPWQEHARWFPDCSFLIQHKSEAYVNEVHRTTADGKKCSRQTILQKKAEKEYKQKVSQQKALHDLCIRLGHERQLVDLAINRNGKAFDNAKDLVAAVYKLEEEEDMGMETERSSQVMHFMSAPSAPIKAQEDVARILNGDQEMLGGIQTDGVELIRSPGTCFNCFNRRGQKIDATEVALPCGHLIFCDKCGRDEKDRVDKSPLYKSKCPTRGCSSLMTGLFKTYVS